MARSRAKSSASTVEGAMSVFWRKGFHATSLDDLVRATGSNRHALYADHGSKEGVFSAALQVYAEKVVSPAIAAMEAEEASLDAITSYFKTQIALADAGGLPGPGCLMANTATERAGETFAGDGALQAHRARLVAAFDHALSGEAQRRGLSGEGSAGLAEVCLAFAEGLWTASRQTRAADPLRASADLFVDMLDQRLGA